MAFDKAASACVLACVLLGCRSNEQKASTPPRTPDATAAVPAQKVANTVVELINFIKANASRSLSELCETLACKASGKAISLPAFGGAILSCSPDPCGHPETKLQLPIAPIFTVQQLFAAWGPPKEFEQGMQAPTGKYTFEAQKLDVIFFAEVGVNSLRFEHHCAVGQDAGGR